MEEEWWERPVCWVCDYWWLLLLMLLMALAAFFTRDSWLPESESGLSNVEVSQPDVTITLRDNGNVIDGDRIDLFLNDEQILFNHTLTRAGDSIDVALDSGRNRLEIVALNEGSSSPNTVAVIISHVVDGPNIQVSDGLLTGEHESLEIKAPR